MTDKNRKRLLKKYKDASVYAGQCAMYDAEPVDAEQYVDPNARAFSKNAYPGNRTMVLYAAMFGAAALIAALGFYLSAH